MNQLLLKGRILMRKNSGWIWLIVVSLIMVILFSSLGCSNTVQVGGHAMEPTVKDGEKVKIDSNAYTNAHPERGDIVLYEQGQYKKIGRVIGLPGETLTIEDDVVFVNGAILEEPYLAPSTRTLSQTNEFEVSDNSYFILGDNREQSQDSRSLGFVSSDKIIARVLR